jgi:phosphatidylglycerol:prolipoprotein diacylglycerol transferase
MRSILFTIRLDASVPLGPLGNVPFFGWGLLLAAWLAVVAGYVAWLWRRRRLRELGLFAPAVWLAVAAAIVLAPGRIGAMPVRGYGTMLFVGFVASAWFTSWRLRRLGYSGELAWDAAVWVFVAGLLGGRTFYVWQYSDRIFQAGQSPAETLFRLINLTDGGLVLYGSVLFGPLAYWVFCRRQGIRALVFGDLVIASVFLGLAFGRLGCFLHGCCYGDFCELPWCVTFPQGSVPYQVQVARGYLADAAGTEAASAPRSLPVHPTQLYDSLNGVVLWLFLWACHPHRRRDGELIAMGCLLYPLNRFIIEFLRADEGGKLNTSLTISQWISMLIFAGGTLFLGWLQTRPAVRSMELMARPAAAS